MEWIINLDGDILLFLQDSVRTPVLTLLFRIITALGNSGVFWVFVSLALLLPKRGRRAGITSILALLLSLLINNILLKNLVARVRPYEVIEGLTPLIAKPWDYSFPSGHTGSSFASAWVFYKMLPKRFGIPALVLAGLIGLSRLYLGVHFPTDVLFGVVSGIGSGCIALLAVKAVIDRRVKSGV